MFLLIETKSGECPALFVVDGIYVVNANTSISAPVRTLLKASPEQPERVNHKLASDEYALKLRIEIINPGLYTQKGH